AFLFGDVGIDDQNRFGVSLFIANQGPPTLNNYFCAVSSRLMYFAFPFSGLAHRLTSSIELLRRFFVQELFGVFANHFFGRPSINLFGSLVPEQNLLVEISYKNGVLCLV